MTERMIAHYRVAAKLGEGGMGEVYRALDTRLNREVALKVLRAAFAEDAERMARFRREAQVLASLNHPNIAILHGLEESGGVRALVMELVEGASLSERIAAGPLQLDDVLNIARQVAEALEAAHDRGVVHRDLKPGNIKVRPDGTVKILDFGLAKALESEPNSVDLLSSPTMTVGATHAGVILGTAAYMSPEQARGQLVDKRADIWGLGCLLYEMLAGRQAFEGETMSDTLAAVLRGEPDWSALPADTPLAIRRLIQRCLVKEPRRRLRDAGEVRLAIEDLQSGWARGEVPATAEPRAQGWQRWLPWALAVFMTFLAAESYLSLQNERSAPGPPTMRFDVVVSPEEPLFLDYGAAAVLSPDGSRMVLVAGFERHRRLYIRTLAELDAAPLSGTEGARDPFFSPDGNWVGFYAEGRLKKVSVRGGVPITLAEVPSMRGGTWGRNGTIVYGADRAAGLWRVSENGGAPVMVTEPDPARNEMSHRWPQFVRGEQVILFTQQIRGTSFDNANIVALDLKTGNQKVLVQGGTYGRYVPTGHLTYVQRGTLYAVPFDVSRLVTNGAPIELIQGVTMSPGSGGAQYSIADAGSGALVYLPGGPTTELALEWVGHDGTASPLTELRRPYYNPRISPDGKRLVVEIFEGGATDLWMLELERGLLTRFTFDPGMDVNPVWSPDGKRVAFGSSRDGGPLNLYLKAADGTGQAQRLTQSEHAQYPMDWSPDGKNLLYIEDHPETREDIWIIPLEGKRAPERLVHTSYSDTNAVFSPDGRWIAYASNEAGQYEIYVRPFRGPGVRWQVSTAGGFYPLWSPSGRELFYQHHPRMMAVGIAREGTSLRIGRPRALFQYQAAQFVFRNFDLAPDGDRFVMIRPSGNESSPLHLHVVLNWFEELRRRTRTQGN